jgi:hypothetical protein
MQLPFLHAHRVQDNLSNNDPQRHIMRSVKAASSESCLQCWWRCCDVVIGLLTHHAVYTHAATRNRKSEPEE